MAGFIIDESTYEGIADHIEKVYPNEACGILIGSFQEKRIYDFKATSNGAPKASQNKHFSVSPLDVYKLEKENKEIIGFYHSHPDNTDSLSSDDKAYMIPNLFYFVASVTRKGIVNYSVYTKLDFNEKALIGKVNTKIQ